MAEDKKEASEEKPADQEANPEAEAGKSKKKRLIILGGGGLVLVLAIGAGAAMFLGGGGADKSTAENASSAATGDQILEDSGGEIEAEKASAPQGKAQTKGQDVPQTDTERAASTGDFGETYQLKTFNLNLGNPLENSYIRIDIAIEYRGGEAQKSELDRRLPQLRDAVVAVVGRKSREFLLGADGKAQLRRELQIQLNRYLTTPIDAVYITDMLIE